MGGELVSAPAYQSLPFQSIACDGSSGVAPSHQMSPSSVLAELVKIVFARTCAIAFGFVL